MFAPPGGGQVQDLPDRFAGKPLQKGHGREEVHPSAFGDHQVRREPVLRGAADGVDHRAYPFFCQILSDDDDAPVPEVEHPCHAFLQDARRHAEGGAGFAVDVVRLLPAAGTAAPARRTAHLSGKRDEEPFLNPVLARQIEGRDQDKGDVVHLPPVPTAGQKDRAQAHTYASPGQVTSPAHPSCPPRRRSLAPCPDPSVPGRAVWDQPAARCWSRSASG